MPKAPWCSGIILNLFRIGDNLLINILSNTLENVTIKLIGLKNATVFSFLSDLFKMTICVHFQRDEK